MSKNNKQPMSLENLPQYIKSLKENGDTGGSNLVSVGQIVVPKRSYLKTSIIVLCFFIGVGSALTYNHLSTNQFTVVVDMDKGINTPQSITKIVTDSGGQVIAVKQNDDLTYEVKIATRKSRHSLLERFRKNKDVKNAE